MPIQSELTKKRMRMMLIAVGILFGLIVIYKIFTALMLKHYLASQSKAVTVSTMQVKYAPWQPRLTASGSLRAIYGVDVTTELGGMVRNIYFVPGSFVASGTLLVQLNIDDDVAQLHSLEANAELAKITYERDKAQFKAQAISKQTLDTDAANLKSLKSQVEQQMAVIAKKTIRAPFAGRLGINKVNPGQYVNPGNKVVSLQTQDPIYADFYMPQTYLAQLKVGQFVTLSSDSFPDKKYFGKITTIDSAFDVNNRNVEVEATISNPKFELTPGMFVSVEVKTGAPKKYLTVPQTAVSFNAYGDIVYVVKQTGKNKTVTQRFVKTGETRGDQVTILQGLSEGDTIVTSGQLKLKNGSQIVVNNSIVPSDNAEPVLNNDH